MKTGKITIAKDESSSAGARKTAKKPARKTVRKTAKKAAGKAPATKAPSVKPRKRARRRVAQKPRAYARGPAILDETALAQAVEALRETDPDVVGAMLEAAGAPPLRRREPGFAGLAWIVVGQQVSVASANAIYARLTGAFPGLAARDIAAADDEGLRACGLSAPKMKTLRAIAHALESKSLDLDALSALSAEEAHAALCAVHGIGPWTADIFLLFCLGHPDAWPAGDLALQEAAKIALNLKTRPDTKKLEKIGERWRPLRGVAARLLWAYYRVIKEGRAGMALA